MTQAEGYAEFVRAHSASLFRTAVLLTGDRVQGEELLQDVLVRLYPKWHRVLMAQSPLAYVRQSLVNGYLSARRGTMRVPRHVLIDLDSQLADPTDPLAPILDRAVLDQALTSLPARQRAAIVLRYLHDQSDADIATAIGCRAVTVRSLISRGLAALRTDLAPDTEDTEEITR